MAPAAGAANLNAMIDMLNAKLLASKKRIGTLRGKPVIEFVTKGGLHLVVSDKDGKPEILGSGPHRCISRFIAEKREPDITFTELSKSDWLDLPSIMSVYDKYVALTDELNGLIRR